MSYSRAYTALCALLLFLSFPNAHAAEGFIINEDDSHFFMFRDPEEMTLEGLNAFVDQYEGTKVSHLFLCPNAQKASYRSAVWDAIWDMAPNQRVKEDESAPIARRWMSNAKLLYDRGLDPYAAWITRCREKGISPWLSMRMNDVHNVDDPDSYIHSRFWMDHPEYWRVPGGAGWTDRAFDYAIPEVREHHIKFIRELLERYDPDGLELDWMRFGYHFAPGKEAEGGALLTQFMREVRALTKAWSEKRGHPILLGARVPTLPAAAAGLGMDGPAWAKEGLVDMLVPTPFWATADFDIPLEKWREIITGTGYNITLAAGIEILLRAYPAAGQALNDIESVRGFAATCLHRGADRIYTFNYMDPAPMAGGEPAYRTLLREGLALETVIRLPRRHPVTYHDTVGPGMSSGVVLPADPAATPEFKLHIGPAPKEGQVIFLAALADKPGVKETVLEAAVNGTPCTALPDRETAEGFPGAVRALRFECPLSAVTDGYNTVRVSRTQEGQPQEIVWAELQMRP